MPTSEDGTHISSSARPSSRWSRLYILVSSVSILYFLATWTHLGNHCHPSGRELARRADILSQCKYIKTPAGPPPNFHSRSKSDRFTPEAKPTLIRNATIWTSGYNGTEVIQGDLLLLKGLIRGVGAIV